MQTKDIVGLTLIPVSLLIAAGTLNVAAVGSVVWFCGLLASAVLILALLSFCYNFSPSTIPLRSFYLVYIGSVSVVGIGMIIRICFHEEMRAQHLWWNIALLVPPRETNLAFVIITGIYEWLSFSGILFCVFFAVRVFARGGADNSQRDQSVTQRQ
jgi:hypothetical protein